MEIIKKITSDTIPINRLSSIFKFDDRYLIKTCFGPDKIVEIKDENGVIYRRGLKFCGQCAMEMEKFLDDEFAVMPATATVEIDPKK